MGSQITFKKDGFYDEEEVLNLIRDNFLDPMDEVNDEENILDTSTRLQLGDLPKETAEEIRQFYQGLIKKNNVNKTLEEFLSEEDIYIRYYDSYEVNENLSITYKIGWVGTYAPKYQSTNKEFNILKCSASDFVINKFKELGFKEF